MPANLNDAAAFFNELHGKYTALEAENLTLRNKITEMEDQVTQSKQVQDAMMAVRATWAKVHLAMDEHKQTLGL